MVLVLLVFCRLIIAFDNGNEYAFISGLIPAGLGTIRYLNAGLRITVVIHFPDSRTETEFLGF